MTGRAYRVLPWRVAGVGINFDGSVYLLWFADTARGRVFRTEAL